MSKNDVSNEENVNEEEGLVILKDEDGNDVRFEFLDFIEYENENYVVLLPVDENDDTDGNEVVILKEDKASESGEEEEYVSVDNEDVLNTVFEMFKDKFKDDFDFTDDDKANKE